MHSLTKQKSKKRVYEIESHHAQIGKGNCNLTHKWPIIVPTANRYHWGQELNRIPEKKVKHFHG